MFKLIENTSANNITVKVKWNPVYCNEFLFVIKMQSLTKPAKFRCQSNYTKQVCGNSSWSQHLNNLNARRHGSLKVHEIHILPHYVNCATTIMHLTYYKKNRVNKIPRCPHTNFSKIVKLQNSSHFLTKIRIHPTTVTQHISKLTQTQVYYRSV